MRIHEQNKVYQEMVVDYRTGLRELRAYLNSAKFSQDVMVNKNDILMRLNELENAIFLHEIKFN